MFEQSILQPSFAFDGVSPLNKEWGPNKGLLMRLVTLSQGGLRWRDISRNNNGTLNSGAKLLATGRNNSFGCINFDNVDDYVDLSSTPSLLSDSSPMTLSWWECITSDSASFPSRFFFKCLGASTRGFLVFRSTHKDYLPLAFLPGDSPYYLRATSAPSIASSVGVWRHWAITCSTNAKSTTTTDWKIYVDGQEYSVTTGGMTGFSSANTNRIGQDNLGDSPANCLMDDVCIWNRCLSTSEIKSIRQDALDRYPNSLNWISNIDDSWVLPTVSPKIVSLTSQFIPTVLNASSMLDSTSLINYEHPLNKGLCIDTTLVSNGGLSIKNHISGKRGTFTSLTNAWGNPNYRDGSYGCIKFDGTGYVDLGIPDANFYGTSTVSAWVYVTGFAKTQSIIASYEPNPQSGQYSLSINTSGKIGFYVYGSGVSKGAISTSSITAYTWYNITVVKRINSGSGQMFIYFYINGILDTTSGALTQYTPPTTYRTCIGNSYNGTSQLTGYIDSCLVYNRELSAIEIKNLYNETKSGNPNRWNFITNSSANTLTSYITISSDCAVDYEFFLSLDNTSTMPYCNFITINTDISLTYEFITDTNTTVSVPYCNLITANKDGGSSYEYLIDYTRYSTIVEENLLSLYGSGNSCIEYTASVNCDASINTERLINTYSQSIISYYTIGVINSDSSTVLEFLKTVNSDSDLILSSLTDVYKEGVLCLEALITLSNDVNIPYESLLSLFSDVIFPYDTILTSNTVNSDAVIVYEISSNLNIDKISPYEFITPLNIDKIEIYENLLNINTDSLSNYESLLLTGQNRVLSYEGLCLTENVSSHTYEDVLILNIDNTILYENKNSLLIDEVLSYCSNSSINTNSIISYDDLSSININRGCNYEYKTSLQSDFVLCFDLLSNLVKTDSISYETVHVIEQITGVSTEVLSLILSDRIFALYTEGPPLIPLHIWYLQERVREWIEQSKCRLWTEESESRTWTIESRNR